MVRQQMVCVVTPGWPGQATSVPLMQPALDGVMEALGCVHFASIAALPPAPGSAPGSLPSLMLELAVDEGITHADLMRRLVDQGLEVLWPLYQADADTSLLTDSERGLWLRGWLLRHALGADGGYVGTRDRSVQQIRKEHGLYRQVRAEATRLMAAGPLDSQVLALKLSAWAAGQDAFAWARTPAPRNVWRRGGLRRTAAALGSAVLLLVCGGMATRIAAEVCVAWYCQWPLLLGLVGLQLVALVVVLLALSPLMLSAMTVRRNLSSGFWRLMRRWDRARHARATREVPRAHQVHPMVHRGEADLIGRPNHMISLTELRAPVVWHAAWLRCWLKLITWVGRWLFANGTLGKAKGIRYGRWHLIDGGRRLLFCSNFDGSFGGYLGEFIAGATVGVNLFWRRTRLLPRPAAAPGHPDVGHARDFPPTRWLSWAGGCQFEQWFKTYARDSMLPHLYLYQAYPHKHAEVERATQLRDALFGPRNLVNDTLIAKAVQS
ncbi:hypothetical protein ACVC7V_07255 [Hydrogenophaga sp. A37]|uniref:hypothetical protein n=1 Tax=Hydrogenophaga sp. A37 TaxID=1945864 RepID=UPI000985043B|nr:hypothetical protein [Hydrogenophaga sp. A37]OOG84606.1 hypothetical protein B0E41_10400 [Hydrogenophaga sp. A37]